MQIIMHGKNFIAHVSGKEELQELVKYAKIALGMQNDPKNPRGNLRIVK